MQEKWRLIAAIILGFLFSVFATLIVTWIETPTPGWFWFAILLLALILLAFLAGLLEAGRSRWWDWQRFRQPIAVGLLNELTDVADRDPGLGMPHCEVAVTRWMEELSRLQRDGKPLFRIDPICFRQISPKFGIILNPFGELYIEEDHLEWKTVRKIKEFLRAGGIFVCTGGIPLYYRWIAETSSRVDTTPRAIIIQCQPQLVSARTRFFDDTLISTEFGVRFSGSPDSEKLWRTYQTQEDEREFGDLVHEGGTDQVLLFRPVVPGRNVIPALRAKINGDNEVYPIAAVSYGKGYLLFSGMHVRNVEFAKIVKAVETLVLRKLRLHQR